MKTNIFLVFINLFLLGYIAYIMSGEKNMNETVFNTEAPIWLSKYSIIPPNTSFYMVPKEKDISGYEYLLLFKISKKYTVREVTLKKPTIFRNSISKLTKNNIDFVEVDMTLSKDTLRKIELHNKENDEDEHFRFTNKYGLE